jgi:hypothetical protein
MSMNSGRGEASRVLVASIYSAGNGIFKVQTANLKSAILMLPSHVNVTVQALRSQGVGLLGK